MKPSGSILRLLGAGCLVTLLSCDFFSDPVTPPEVAGVRVTPGSVYLQLGTSAQLTAVTLDAAGNELFGREVSWTSSDPTIASVGAAGVVTGVAEGGPVTVTASSGGKTGTSEVRVASTVLTGIRDIQTFLEKCPANDPAYPRLREDFHLRVDGDLILDPIPCSEPYSAMPVEELSNVLIAVQAFRAAYHMSQGMEGHLPWTDQGLYGWMASYIDGVHLKTAPGMFYCCDLIDGEIYVSQSVQDADEREQRRTWPGIASTLAYFAHEVRHADPTGGQDHTTGCEAFPLPTDVAGCDPSYDLSNLGSYGVQYWLIRNWATGYLNVGVGCADSRTARDYVAWLLENLNAQLRRRFVTKAPPVLTLEPPYGGPCVPVGTPSGWIENREP